MRTLRHTLTTIGITAVLLTGVLATQARPEQERASAIETVAPARAAAPDPSAQLRAARAEQARREAFTAWVNTTLRRQWIEAVTLAQHPCRDDVERAIRSVFAGTGRVDYFIGIAWRESRCNPLARNPNGGKVDSGVFQLRMPTHAHRVRGCDVFETWCNVRGARSLYDECSIGPWDKAGGYWCSPP